MMESWHPYAVLVRQIEREGQIQRGLYIVRFEMQGAFPPGTHASILDGRPMRHITVEPYERELPGVIYLDGQLGIHS